MRPLIQPVKLLRAAVTSRRPTLDYVRLYEKLDAAGLDDAEIVGGSDFEYFGSVELAALRQAGLKPSDVLVDFGCGTARLAVHVVPYLNDGAYIGVDISRNVLRRAERNVRRAHPEPPCRIVWIHNTSATFPLEDGSADVICAFSVFTHMEHEDAYRYLADGIRVVRPGGRFVFSCLPLELDYARDIFVESARMSLKERWRSVRNVVTSRDLMTSIASLAGWRVIAWYRGDENAFDGRALGQSVCVLERP